MLPSLKRQKKIDRDKKLVQRIKELGDQLKTSSVYAQKEKTEKNKALFIPFQHFFRSVELLFFQVDGVLLRYLEQRYRLLLLRLDCSHH